MNPNQLKQLEKLSKVFNTSNIISPEDIQEVLKGISLLLADYRKGTVELTEDVKKTFEDVINTISDEHDKILKEVKNTSETAKSEATEAVTKALEDVKRIAKEVMEMKPKDGERGLDADEEIIVEKVLGKIVLPEYKETVLDSGEQIVDKINALDLSPENQIDASHIKNLPQPRMIGGGSTARNLYQLGDVSVSGLANNDVLKYNSTTELWENGVGGGGATAFTDLTDVPSSYSGQAGKAVRVNVGETGLEFFTASGTGTVTSVAATVPTGLTISGSPVTTSGTLAIALDTGYVIPLQTTLDGFVPYTGATTNVDLGAHNLTVDTDTFFVDSTNNIVGIGGASPVTKLDIFGTASGAGIRNIVNDSTDPSFQFTVSGATDWKIGIDNSDSDKFKISDSSSLGTSDRLVITTGGNLGIGTSTPASKLTIYQSAYTSAEGITFDSIGGSAINNGLYRVAASQMALRSGGTDVFFDSGDVRSSSGFRLRNVAGAATTPTYAWNGDPNTGMYNPSADALGFSTAGLERLRIDSSGLVGIGTTTPDQLLHEEVSDAGTNAVVFGQRHSHITSGTATTGFGIGEEYELENASGTNRVAGTNEFAWTDATNATEDASWKLKLMRAGTLTEALGVDSLGTMTVATNIELGHASDTTISRSSAGVIAVEGVTVATASNTLTLSNKTLTEPKFVDGGFIADANGNEMIIFDTVASAVNEITLANAATTGTPTISATGGDTNINLQLTPKGTGIVKGELKRFMVRLLANTTDTATGTTIGGDYRISNRAITVKAVGAYVDTAGTTNTTTIDINEAGTTILSTKITIDSTEKSSETAATAPVISDTAIAADAVVTFDIDAISTTAAKGLTVWVDYVYA